MLCNMFTNFHKLKKHGWHVNLKSTAVTCLYIAQPCTARTFSSQLKPEKMRQSKKGLSTFQPIFQYLSICTINRMLMMLICGRIHLCTMLPTELGPFWHPRACLMSLGFQGRTWALWCETSFDLTRSRIWLQLQDYTEPHETTSFTEFAGLMIWMQKTGPQDDRDEDFRTSFGFWKAPFAAPGSALPGSCH